MNPDYLPLIAEIGVALAGFGGLAGLIGQQGSSESPAVDAARLRGMLQRALTVVLLALLPIALGQFELADTLVWHGCAAVLFVAAPVMNWSQIFRLRRLPNYAPGIAYFASAQIAMIVQLGALGTGFAGYVSLPAAYGLALLIELSLAAGQFLRVVASITLGRT